MKYTLIVTTLGIVALATAPSRAHSQKPPISAPADVRPGSITCEDVPYPYPVSYLSLTLYGQDVRIAFMDVAPIGQPNGHVVVLLHGNNFAGFYFGPVIDALRRQGFRVIAPIKSDLAVRRSRSCRTTSTTWRATRGSFCRA